jgi:hypothetical protein
MQTNTHGRAFGQYIIVVVLFLFGIITLWNSSLIDWDEGVFALQGQWFASTGSQGKPFNFQTPPLFQMVIAGSFCLAGHHWYILPLLSILCSCITLYFVYAMTTSLFSQKEALYAMVLVASTELFLFFSRSGLSDALFLFLFTGAVFFFVQGLRRDRLREFVFAGVFATLALYTKYSTLPLLVAFTFIGIRNRKNITKPWLLISVLGPIILFLPYVITFIAAVQPSMITIRHGSLIGLNHFKYLYYAVIFSPIVFLLGLISLFIKKVRVQSISIYMIAAIYMIFLGFYHPYMRLLLPLIPLCAITGSRVIASTKKLQIPFLVVSAVFGLLLSISTLKYTSSIPRDVGAYAARLCDEHACNFIYAAVPPNITFNLPGNIMVREDHAWVNLGKKLPFVMRGKTIMQRSTNMLHSERSVLYIHATIFDSLKLDYPQFFARMTLLWETAFKDAPLYNKDPYNELRDVTQEYEIYIIPLDTELTTIEQCWQFGFEPVVTVLEQ